MKVNEAPERIWIDPTIDLPKLSGHIDKDSIEYTRADAFMKKACDWLKENYKDYIIVDIDNKYEGIDGLFLEDFKNYMKNNF